MCHRQFFEKFFQNPEYVQIPCNGRNKCFHFANRNWMIKQEVDIDEN